VRAWRGFGLVASHTSPVPQRLMSRFHMPAIIEAANTPILSARRRMCLDGCAWRACSSGAPCFAPPCRAAFDSSEAILEEVQKLKSQMFAQRIKFAKREEYKPAQYADLRTKVAQLLTIKREREIEQGIDKRDARAMEKRRLVEAGLGRF